MTADTPAQQPQPPQWPGIGAEDLLLSSKITQPALPHWFVPRPRLDRHIAEGARNPLTVVTGPPGAGKTIAMASWAASHSGRGQIAWVSLDEYDKRPRLFWSYVVHALQSAGVAVPGDLWAPIEGRTGYDGLTFRLAAALAAHGSPVFLVLDDLHLVSGRRIMDALDRLLRNGYPNLHLVAGSRSDPLLSLYRYRLAGQLTEVRAGELEFRLPEARTLLRQHGISLTAQSQQSLTRRTEGWAAPLRLAAISMQCRPDPDGFVSEIAAEDSAVPAYLVEEVLNAQPDAVRNLMMRTSILDRISIGLADELSDDETARTALPALAQDNAFVQPLGHGWYRYHPLLAEVMRLKFRRESPGQVTELRRRAARWLHRHGSDREAVTQAAEAGDWPLAARIVIDELATVRLMSPRGGDPLAEAVRDIPRGATWTEPQPWLVEAALDLSEGSRDTAAASLLAAERVLRRRPAGQDRPVRLAAAIIRLALLSQAGQWRSAAAAAEQAQALFTSIPEGVRARHPEVRVQLLIAAGAAEVWAGQFDAAAAALAAATPAAEDDGQRALGLEHLALAEAFRGRLSHAADLAAEVSAPTQADPAGNTGPPSPLGLVTLAFVHAERHELRDAHLRLKQVGVALHTRPCPMSAAIAALVAAHVFLAEGRARMALDIAGRARRGPSVCEWLDRRLILAQSTAYAAMGEAGASTDAARKAGAGRYLDATAAFAQAALTAGHAQAAGDALAAWAAGPDGAPDRMRIGAWLAEARLGYGRGDRAAGCRAFQQALNLAAAERVRLPFVLQHGWIQAALHGDPELARAYRRQLDPAGQILPPTAITAVRPQAAPPEPFDAPLVLEKLSGRERQVLECASQLLDTTEIASELYISVNTVKSHFKSIFRKLDATSRNEAVRRARKLELI
jgi:LuxR family transcriptional regulator, maltose regulon positive regulatory protein